MNGDQSINVGVEPFDAVLLRYGVQLLRERAVSLQINTGSICNLACSHCHQNAGPDRAEFMGEAVMQQVVDYAKSVSFDTIDITGGAPELVPGIEGFIARLAPLTKRLIFRSNLTALYSNPGNGLLELLCSTRVIIIASLSSTNACQADNQRGDGVFATSVSMLKRLNELGYGKEGSGLELNLAVNPTGAFLPADQKAVGQRFKQVLLRKHGVVFNNLFTFANVPLGRFRDWLERSGNLNSYMKKLAGSFNPETTERLMCRTLVSVDHKGYLYDCDFNLAAGCPMGGAPKHLSEISGRPTAGIAVAVGDYCYACTAGSGFTCQGAVT